MRAEIVGLIVFERRHAVRAAEPDRTLCGIRTGMRDVEDVPGLTAFAGAGEGGFKACRRCLPMRRRLVLSCDRSSEIAPNSSISQDIRVLMGGQVAS